MPGLAHAMWAHGTSMQIEYPDRVYNVRRAGHGMYVESKAGQENWFHFAIPTPVIVSGHRLRLESVLVNMLTGSTDVVVNHVHIYDGDSKLHEHDNLGLSGEVGMRRFDVPGHPEVKEGIGISIGVGFGVESMSHRMKFIAAGADFID